MRCRLSVAVLSDYCVPYGCIVTIMISLTMVFTSLLTLPVVACASSSDYSAAFIFSARPSKAKGHLIRYRQRQTFGGSTEQMSRRSVQRDDVDGNNESGIGSTPSPRRREDLQSSLTDLFNSGGSRSSSMDGSSDNARAYFLEGIDDSIDDLTQQSEKALAPSSPFRTNFPEEGPLYELGGTGSDIDYRLEQELAENKEKESNGKVEGEEEDEEDSPFLSEEEYKRAIPGRDGSILLPDEDLDDMGGLRGSKGRGAVDESYRRITEQLLESSSPVLRPDEPPDQIEGSPDDAPVSLPDLESNHSEEILRALKEESDGNKVDPEVLHRRVFANETGYLQQQQQQQQQQENEGSKDIAYDEAEEDPVAFRRSAAYRQHRDEVLSKLEREMEELLHSLSNRTLSRNESGGDESIANAQKQYDSALKCNSCGCLLSPVELKHARELGPGRKHLCRVCDAKRFIERRPYWRAPDPPIDRFRKSKVVSRDRVKKEDQGPAQTWSDGGGRAQKSKVDPKKWRARYAGAQSGQADQNSRRIRDNPHKKMTRSSSAGQKLARAGPDLNDKENNLEEQNVSLPPSQIEVESLNNQLYQAEFEIEKLRNVIQNMEDSLHSAEPIRMDDDFGEVNGRSEGEDWVRVKDPDTGEIFLWNEETEEMKWDN